MSLQTKTGVGSIGEVEDLFNCMFSFFHKKCIHIY